MRKRAQTPQCDDHTNENRSTHQFKNLHVGTINIIDGRQGRLEMICHTLNRHEIDIGVLTETKLNGYHTMSAYGYTVMASKGSTGHQGGVAFVVRESQHWHIEGFKMFGPNVIKCTIVHNNTRTTLIGIYIPPSEVDLQTIAHLDKALQYENIEKTIIMGDFNVNIKNPKDSRQQDIVDAIFTYELRNLASLFKCKRQKPYTWTWRTNRNGQNVQSICDYILTGCGISWKNCKLVDLPFDTDHRMVKGKLISQISKKYKNYLKER